MFNNKLIIQNILIRNTRKIYITLGRNIMSYNSFKNIRDLTVSQLYILSMRLSIRLAYLKNNLLYYTH